MIPKELADYCQVPFVAGGRDPSGWDCYGLVWYIGKQHFGLELPSYKGQYDTDFNFDAIGELVENEKTYEWSNIEDGQEVPGDLVLMRMRGHPVHVGLVVDKNYMIHVLKRNGTVVQNYTGVLWKKRLMGFWRYDS